MFPTPLVTRIVAGAGAGLLLLGASTTAAYAAKPSPAPGHSATATNHDKTDHRDRKVALDDYLKASATVLKMSPADLRAAFKNGKSLSDLATAKGFKKKADFAKAVTKAATPLLEADVKSGKLSRKEATRMEHRLAAGKLPFWDRHHKSKTPKK